MAATVPARRRRAEKSAKSILVDLKCDIVNRIYSFS